MSMPGFGADGRITYNFDEIFDVATAIRTYEDVMDDALLRLFNDFQNMFDDHDWSGQAGQACRDAHKNCDIGAKKIKDALGQVGSTLHLAARTSRSSTTTSPRVWACDRGPAGSGHLPLWMVAGPDQPERRGRVVSHPEWTVDRPSWSSVGEMMAELRQAIGTISESQRKMMQVTGTAWSPDRSIKAVVGPRGQLLALDIDPRVFRKPNSKALADQIITTVRLAVEDATEQVRTILEANVPTDFRIQPSDGLDIGRLMHTHDADLLLEKDDDNG